MEGHARISILLLAITLVAANALEGRKMMHIPEKIIGGVIDIVQNHKNKPTQQTTTVQTQTQQQSFQQGYPQQYAPWNTGYQNQGQSQYQGQYVNYGYPQQGSYPQGGYLNNQVYPSNQQFGASQVQGQYQQANTFDGQQGNQFQTQGQVQNQFQNQQAGQFGNQNQQITSGNYQGAQPVNQPAGQQVNYQPVNQPSGGFVQSTGSYGGHQSSNFGSQQSSFVGQTQPSNNYVGSPQGQVPQSTFVGQNVQSSHFQGQAGNGAPGFAGSNNGSFQTTGGGHQVGTPGPTCVCQAWTKPQNGVLNDNGTQRSEEKDEKAV
ncbi:PIN+ prion protein RNQ1-like [Spodoptera litura]|uniref:PIN+ prion protein RNQ1-like n=1 Tax=Spodoptera litura TaxID=69820 RepID=A0A9J7E2D3_SPOLT|nr:PIN+ prion protein RNQ1-like [Spodoptera litura]